MCACAGRYTKKKKIGTPTFEWELVFVERCQKKQNNEAIFCCERDAA